MKSKSIIRLLSSGLDFALYRFPGESQPHLVLQKEGQASHFSLLTLHSSLNTTDTSGASGFLFAPFAETRETPTLLIRPDIAVRGWDLIDLEARDLPHQRSMLSAAAIRHHCEDIRESSDYKKAFSTFRYQLDRGNYQTLFLSHSRLEVWSDSGNLPDRFITALQQHPDDMVYLVSTRQGGRWFGHTSDLLLEGFDRKWHTKATSTLVSDYIEGQLQGLGCRIMRDGTDFTFHLQKVVPAYTLATLLYPTPLVCGLPKDEAWRFIRLHEHNRRMYYTGYLGPINLRTETNLFINTQCINIRPQGRALFFAGTSITRQSRYEEECERIREKIRPQITKP